MNVRDLLLGLAVSGAIFSTSTQALANTCETQFSSMYAQAEFYNETINIAGAKIKIGQFKSFLSGTELKALHRETVTDWENSVFTVDVGRAPGKSGFGFNQFEYDRNLVRINYMGGASEYYLVVSSEAVRVGDISGIKLYTENKFGEQTEFLVQDVKDSTSSFFSGKTGQGVTVEAPLKLAKNSKVQGFGEQFAVDMSKANVKYQGMNINEALVVPGGPVWVNTVEWLEVPIAVQNSLPEMDRTYTTYALKVQYTDGEVAFYHVDDISGDEGLYTLLLDDENGDRVGDLTIRFESGELFEGKFHMSGLFPKGTGVSITMNPVKKGGTFPPTSPFPPWGGGQPFPGPSTPTPVGLPQPGPVLPDPVGLPQTFPSIINGIVAPNPNVVGLPQPGEFVTFGDTTVMMATFQRDRLYVNLNARATVFPAPLYVASAEYGRANTVDFKSARVFKLLLSDGRVLPYLLTGSKVVDGTTIDYQVVNPNGKELTFTTEADRHGGEPVKFYGSTADGLSFSLNLASQGNPGRPVGLPQPGTGNDDDIAGITIPIGLPFPGQNQE